MFSVSGLESWDAVHQYLQNQLDDFRKQGHEPCKIVEEVEQDEFTKSWLGSIVVSRNEIRIARES